MTEYNEGHLMVAYALEAIHEGNVIKERKYTKQISRQLCEDFRSCEIPNRKARGKKISKMIFNLPSPSKKLDKAQHKLVSNILYDLGFDDEYAHTHMQADYRYVFNKIKDSIEEDNLIAS